MRLSSINIVLISMLTVSLSFKTFPKIRGICNNHQFRRFAHSTSENPSNLDKKSKAKGKGKDTEGKYSQTCLLPITSFKRRTNSINKEPEIQKWWEDNQIYNQLSSNNLGEKFILHDGPPCANGDLHIGHALNKILKDFINRYQILLGKKVRYVPGWDCHGLPIEFKILQSLKTDEREKLLPISLRKKAAQFAQETISKQMKSFKRYGIWGEWDKPYATLQPEYEAEQIKVFGEMVANGHIYRGKKPVHWSPSSRTALAEAELEYPDDHISKSIYVGFDIIKLSPRLQEIQEKFKMDSKGLRVAIWTTTPWTIPANLAVAVNADLEYCFIHHESFMNNAVFIVAKDLVATLSSKFKTEFNMIDETFRGSEVAGTLYQHPLYERQSSVIVGGDYITTESGTGLVHTAPGHGEEDYITGLKYNLPLLSPVNDLGKFTTEAGEVLQGLDVLTDGTMQVISMLNSTGVLMKVEPYNHRYPYDWRTKKPTIFRATEQWFASVSNIREDALKAINEVNWIPSIGRNRISAMTSSRGDWCISRQRCWGVPIPVFYNKLTNESLMTPETLLHIQSIFKVHGSDAWWQLEVADLLPPGQLRDKADEYSKGTDTMDVWFDSGTSWAGVAKAREELQYPVDVYFEGSDQHRGWFQSSLLTSVASQGKAPYKTVLTHGFVLDEKGFKMSKSLGNVVDPVMVIEGGSNQKEQPAYGADTLRLWVSSVDYTGDVCLGQNIMKQVSDGYRKIRNTIRYVLGSLNDFDPEKNLVPYENLPSIDRYILGQLTKTVEEIQTAYDQYEFFKANQALTVFTSNELSAFYLEIAKDRLYISSKDEFRRRSCQTTLHYILLQLIVVMSPILPHLAEEAWQNIPFKKSTMSVFQRGWVSKDDRFPIHREEDWNFIRSARNDVNKCMELARQDKLVGASMECRVVIHSDNPQRTELLQSMKGDEKLLPTTSQNCYVDDLRFIFIASQVDVYENPEEDISKISKHYIRNSSSESKLAVGITKAHGNKCDRCWYYSEDVGHHSGSDICLRCAEVIKTDGYVLTSNESIEMKEKDSLNKV